VTYKGFTWNLTYGEAQTIAMLLERHVLYDEYRATPAFRGKIDRKLATALIVKAHIFMELNPDGATTTHGTADA